MEIESNHIRNCQNIIKECVEQFKKLTVEECQQLLTTVNILERLWINKTILDSAGKKALKKYGVKENEI